MAAAPESGADAAPERSCRRREWVDPDTPVSACQQTDHTGRPLELVFSDEFNVPGRTFKDGEDPVWTALVNFPSTQSQINAYDDSEEFVTTQAGKLRIKVENRESRQRYVNTTTGESHEVKRAYTSGMLQTWNKFCFTEGVVELSARLPGEPDQAGLWPAFWLMGNLGRATVQASTDFVWPYSFAQCPAAEDAWANQDPRQQQAINECLGGNWTERFGLNPGQGRGAVEIDVLEAKPGKALRDYKRDFVETGKCPPLTEDQYRLLEIQQPTIYTNLIVAPGIPLGADQRPSDASGGAAANCMPTDWSRQWYPELKPGTDATYGREFGATVGEIWGSHFNKLTDDGRQVRFQSDQISAASSLPRSAFKEQHVYRLEWRSGEDGFLRFSIDGKFLYQVNAEMLQRDMGITAGGEPRGTLFGRSFPVEPMYMILNIDMSTIWNWNDDGCKEQNCKCCLSCSDMSCWFCLVNGTNKREWLRELCTTLPAWYEIDYVRVYQPESQTNLGCSPDTAPTQGWIEEHRPNYYAPYAYEPLEPVFAGGAACSTAADCGVDRGQCEDGACSCAADFTGPRCLVRRAGAAVACAPLEEAIFGGARCDHNATASCGPHGKCMQVDLPWDSGSQEVAMPDGSSRAAGPPDGRCRCDPGWGGPHCRRPQQQPSSGGQCAPEAWLNAMQLEGMIESVCSRTRLKNDLTRSITEACAQVQWKPHWEYGGNFSRCGAWPRASMVVAAVQNDTGLCCRRLVNGALDCVETGTTFPFLLSVAGAVLLAMAFVGCLVQVHLRGGICPGRSGKGRTRRVARKDRFHQDGFSFGSDEAEDLGDFSSEES